MRVQAPRVSGILPKWPRITSASASTRSPILPVTLSWVLYYYILEMGKVICFYAPEAVSNISYSYTEAILENGAFVVENMRVLRPFVLNGHGATPGHAGVIINCDHWEFRGSTDSNYADGKAVIETVCASVVGMTGDEFYKTLPSNYDYRGHFRNYAIPYPGCWANKACIARFDIPEGTPDIYGKGYCIHPG